MVYGERRLREEERIRRYSISPIMVYGERRLREVERREQERIRRYSILTPHRGI
jgi:hypothetical protein